MVISLYRPDTRKEGKKLQVKTITGNRKPDPKIIAVISAAVDAYQESITVDVTEQPIAGVLKLRSESLWKQVGLLELLAARDLGNKL